MVGALTVVCWCIHPFDAGGLWPGLGLLIFPACWSGAVVVHEIGHLVAARALRLNPFSVLLGHGPAVWEGFWAGVHWTFKAVPNMGLVRVWPVQRSCLRWRMLLLLGAGPATNAM